MPPARGGTVASGPGPPSGDGVDQAAARGTAALPAAPARRGAAQRVAIGRAATSLAASTVPRPLAMS
ncbi:MAG: hypothetical protein ABR511_09605 [Acidimicrobiales bacterium]